MELKTASGASSSNEPGPSCCEMDHSVADLHAIRLKFTARVIAIGEFIFAFVLRRTNMPYKALKRPVRHGAGDGAAIPPDAFLDELIAWGRSAPDEIFLPRGANEVYVTVVHFLGPYNDGLHRRAVMLEVMRVLAGHETEWDWNHGVDGNPQPEVKTVLTTEAGAWQVSANSMANAPELRHLVLTRVGSDDPIQFQQAMKTDHVLAMEYIARSLRNRVDTHGPCSELKGQNLHAA